MLQPPFDVHFQMRGEFSCESPDGTRILMNETPPFSLWDGKVYELNVYYPGLCVARAEADGHSPTDIVGFGLALSDGTQYLCLCPLDSALRHVGGHGSPGMLAWFLAKLRKNKPNRASKRSASAEVRACLGRAAAKINKNFLTQDPAVMTRVKLTEMINTVVLAVSTLDNVEEEGNESTE